MLKDMATDCSVDQSFQTELCTQAGPGSDLICPAANQLVPLRTHPELELARINALLSEDFSTEEIAEAVDWASVDNLRQMEREGKFRQGGMTLRNPDDPNSFKVRRAKIGGYRDYFNGDELEELGALVQARLDPALGYTSDHAGL